MAKAAKEGGLPEEIVISEILLRLPPKSLLRCRAVCRAWLGATSTRDFLLDHHDLQPALPIVIGSERTGARYKELFAFDHRAAGAQLQRVARLDERWYRLAASCDGLLFLVNYGTDDTRFSICNLVTREHATLQRPPGFSFFGMYPHRSTGEYRLLLHRRGHTMSMQPDGHVGCYVFTLGIKQPPRYIGGPSEASELCFKTAVLLRDSMHWYPSGRRFLLVFDTTTESFRKMRAPVVPAESHIFEMDGTLGIYNNNRVLKVVQIWVLQNYETEDWEYRYRVELPVAEIRVQFGSRQGNWDVSVVLSTDGDVLLMVSHCEWLFCVDTAGKLVESFHRDDQDLYACGLRLKQTLVPHTFFTVLEDYAVNDSARGGSS